MGTSPTRAAAASVVKVTKTSCKPFVLEVMVVSPEQDYKFEVLVDKSCVEVDGDKRALWKLVFDLYKKSDEGGFDQLVHVSYRAKNPNEAEAVKNMLDGVTEDQADVLINQVHPAAKQFSETPSEENKTAVVNAMRKVATANIDA
jgi:hypothetical protein